MAEQRFDEQIQMSPSTSPGTVKEAGSGIGSDISAGAGTVSGDVQQGAQNLNADMQDMSSKIQQGKNRLFSYGRDVYDRVSQRVGQIPGSSRDLISNVDSQVRARPWLIASIVGLSTLAIGYALGRSLKLSSPTISPVGAEDIEDYT